MPQLVHVVFGLSKDFCASGLRVGGLHTRNSTLMQVCMAAVGLLLLLAPPMLASCFLL